VSCYQWQTARTCRSRASSTPYSAVIKSIVCEFVQHGVDGVLNDFRQWAMARVVLAAALATSLSADVAFYATSPQPSERKVLLENGDAGRRNGQRPAASIVKTRW
jgi:hypothetical protein